MRPSSASDRIPRALEVHARGLVFLSGLPIFPWIEVTTRDWASGLQGSVSSPSTDVPYDLGLCCVLFLGLSSHVCEMGRLNSLRSIAAARPLSYDSSTSSVPLGWETEREGWMLTVLSAHRTRRPEGDLFHGAGRRWIRSGPSSWLRSWR